MSPRGELPPSKRQRRDYGEASPLSKRYRHSLVIGIYQSSYSEIDLDDLHELETSSGITLEMQDRQRYFNALTLKEGEELDKQASGNCFKCNHPTHLVAA